MTIVAIPFVLAIAAVMTILLLAVCTSLGLQCKGSRMFLILVAATWWGGLLPIADGPLLCGVPWLALFIAGLFSMGTYLELMLVARRLTRMVSTHLDTLLSYDARERHPAPMGLMARNSLKGN